MVYAGIFAQVATPVGLWFLTRLKLLHSSQELLVALVEYLAVQRPMAQSECHSQCSLHSPHLAHVEIVRDCAQQVLQPAHVGGNMVELLGELLHRNSQTVRST